MNRDLIFIKLKIIGLFGDILSVIKNMYAHLEYSVKLPHTNKCVLAKSFTAGRVWSGSGS